MFKLIIAISGNVAIVRATIKCEKRIKIRQPFATSNDPSINNRAVLHRATALDMGMGNGYGRVGFCRGPYEL